MSAPRIPTKDLHAIVHALRMYAVTLRIADRNPKRSEDVDSLADTLQLAMLFSEPGSVLEFHRITIDRPTDITR